MNALSGINVVPESRGKKTRNISKVKRNSHTGIRLFNIDLLAGCEDRHPLNLEKHFY